MPIKTQQSLSGFIRGDMELRNTSNGRPMFTAKAGQNQFEHLGQGQFRQLDNEFIPIVQFGNSAKKSFEQFRPGDRFIAEGYTRDYTYTKDGEERTEQQFVVKKIGHDTAWTNYDVHRKEAAPAVDQEAAGQEVAQEQASNDLEHEVADMEPGAPDMAHEAPDAEPSQVEQTRRLPTVSGSGMTRQQEPVGASAQVPM